MHFESTFTHLTDSFHIWWFAANAIPHWGLFIWAWVKFFSPTHNLITTRVFPSHSSCPQWDAIMCDSLSNQTKGVHHLNFREGTEFWVKQGRLPPSGTWMKVPLWHSHQKTSFIFYRLNFKDDSRHEDPRAVFRLALPSKFCGLQDLILASCLDSCFITYCMLTSFRR